MSHNHVETRRLWAAREDKEKGAHKDSPMLVTDQAATGLLMRSNFTMLLAFRPVHLACRNQSVPTDGDDETRTRVQTRRQVLCLWRRVYYELIYEK